MTTSLDSSYGERAHMELQHTDPKQAQRQDGMNETLSSKPVEVHFDGDFSYVYKIRKVSIGERREAGKKILNSDCWPYSHQNCCSEHW